MRKATAQKPALGYVCEVPKLTSGSQIGTMRAHDMDDAAVVVDGSKRPSGERRNWSWLLARLRPGDLLALVQLRVIYVPHKRLSPRKSLFKRLHALEDAGVTVVELSTGRRSDRSRDRDMMIADALDEIARARKGGAKRRVFSEDELALVRREWTSTRHATNQAAVDAILAEARERGMITLLRLRSVQAFGNTFGGSGRPRSKRK